MALRMYAYGAVDTLSQAAEAMGISLGYLSLVRNSVPGSEFMESCDQILNDRALEGAALLERLGRRGVEIVARLAEHAESEKVQLTAAQDLADRSQTYSKVQRHQVEAITLSGKDAKDIAEALVRGPMVHEKYAHLAHGDFNKIEDGLPSSNSSAPDSGERAGVPESQRLLGTQSS